MRKTKLEEVSNYYNYKQNKLFIRRLIVLALMISIIGSSFVISGRWGMDYVKLKPRVDKTGDLLEVYIDSTIKGYDLYNPVEDIKGIYIPASKVVNYKEYIELTKETAVNSFVIDIKDDNGYLTIPSDNPILVDKGCVLASPPIENIEKVIKACYEEGIYPIARIVAFKDNVITKKEPSRAVKNLSGETYVTSGGDRWLNPYDKRNWEYLLEICKEAISLGFKEIQFDYIRFHESMNENRVILDGEKSKVEIISEFAKYMYDNLHSYDVFVSADVFGAVILSDIDANIVGQDFSELCKWLDYICPMVYPSHYAQGTFGIEYPHIDCYDIILRSMELAGDKLSENLRSERKAIIRPWLQDFTMKSLKPYKVYGEEELKDQIQGTYDAGLSEWLFWNAAGNYTEAGLKD